MGKREKERERGLWKDSQIKEREKMDGEAAG